MVARGTEGMLHNIMSVLQRIPVVICWRKRKFHPTGALMASALSSNLSGDGLVSLRLTGVPGNGEKVNDVFVYGNAQNCSEHIIYFGGDVQDYPENMERHRDNKRYVKWNTENTAKLIHRKFPTSLVFVIKATRMHLLTFAVYSNFMETNDFGSPTHGPDFGAIEHLSSLYSSAVKEVKNITDVKELKCHPIKIIGFSKGCTVLNQLVFELHLLEKHPPLQEFMSKVQAFYWLDGGHSGGTENTWVTNKDDLSRLASLGCHIFIHVTPKQVRDPMRKWIGQQEAKFYKTLTELNAKVVEKLHFADEPASIENHFKVLEIF